MKTPDAFAFAYPLEILFVNDGKADLTPTKLHLAHLGYEPDQAFSTGEVFEMAANKQYDIILLDSRVPDPERIFDLAGRSGSNAPLFVGLFTSLPVKRKEFLSQLKACSIQAGRRKMPFSDC